MTPALVGLLTDAKAAAEASDKKREGLAPLSLGDVAYHVRATGTKGYRWQLECDDYLLLFANPDTDWPVSIRYTAAGLWKHGPEALRTRALKSLAAYTTPNTPDFMRVTRADYCFDFHSPAFFAEFSPGALQRAVVCHSSCKVREVGAGNSVRSMLDRGETLDVSKKSKLRVSVHDKTLRIREPGGKTWVYDLWAQDDDYSTWSTSHRGETLDIGKKSSLQVSVYDKTLEITEASGKTWFYDLWARDADGEVFDSDVARVEIRMSSEFLKERNVRRSHELMAQRPQLLVEALYNRRLTVPSDTDGNRRRWPMHPLWSEAVRMSGATAMLPIGRKLTGAREAVVKQLRAQFRGLIRTMSAAQFGEYNEDKLRDTLANVWKETTDDPEHARKLSQALLRYEDLEEAH